MSTIEKIKEEMGRTVPPPWDERIALLVEYFEAAEAEFKYVGASGDTETYRRLQKARAELGKKTP